MTVTWANFGGGNWDAGGNWSSGVVPAGTDDVLINSGAFTITFDATDRFNQTESVASLTLSDSAATLALNAGTLSTTGTVALNEGTLALNPNATLAGATVVANAGSAIFAGGTANGVTWLGLLDLNADSAVLDVTGGLDVQAAGGTQPGTITVSGIASGLNILNTQTFSDVVMDLGAPGAGATVAAAVPVPRSVIVTYGTLSFAADTLIDVSFNATINAATITNLGSIHIENGGSLLLNVEQNGSFVNSGSVSIAPFGSFDLIGSTTLPDLGDILSAGGKFIIGTLPFSMELRATIGVLDLLSGSITIGGSTGPQNLELDGVLRNGTVVNSGGTFVMNGTLNNITWLGDLNIGDYGDYDAHPALENVTFRGLDGVSPGVINLYDDNSGIQDYLTAGGTLANVTINIEGPWTGGLTAGIQANTLTLAASGTLNTATTTYITGSFTNQGLMNESNGTLVFQSGLGTNAGVIETTGTAGGIEIDSSRLSNAGTISGHSITINVQQLINSGQIAIHTNGTLQFGDSDSDSGTLTFAGTSGVIRLETLAGFGATIANWTAGDEVELAQLGSFTYSFDAASTNSTLIIDQNGVQALTLAVGPGFLLGEFSIAQGGVNQPSFVHLPCYACGTRVAIPGGEVAIETLTPGDIILLASGEVAPVRWIGRRRVDCYRQPKPDRVWPVRVRAHAFGPDLPRRDLFLSPDHSVFVDDVLIPIHLLINHTTIQPEERRVIEYFHLRLDRHEIMLADGPPAETWLPTNNQAVFDNGGAAMAPYPNMVALTWEMTGCAPLLLTGGKLAAIRLHLADRGRNMIFARTGRSLAKLAPRGGAEAFVLAMAGRP